MTSTNESLASSSSSDVSGSDRIDGNPPAGSGPGAVPTRVVEQDTPVRTELFPEPQARPPSGTVAALRSDKNIENDLLTYEELLDFIAVKCDGFSGASLAGVARAAASRALERAVCDFTGDLEGGDVAEGYSISDCLVTKLDIEEAIDDVMESSREGDGGEEEEVVSEDGKKSDN